MILNASFEVMLSHTVDCGMCANFHLVCFPGPLHTFQELRPIIKRFTPDAATLNGLQQAQCCPAKDQDVGECGGETLLLCYCYGILSNTAAKKAV